MEVSMKELTKTATAGGADRNQEQDVLRPEDLARMQNGGDQESTPPDIIIEN
jgi:hypothetical protein